MNKRIMKKRAFAVVNEATEFTLRMRHPKRFIKEGYKLLKVFKSNPDLFVKRGQHVEPVSKLTPEEAMAMWGTPEYKEDRERKQAILDKYGKDVVWLSDEAFAKVMAVRGLNDLLKEKKKRRRRYDICGD
jgi:hypothetical protein